MLLSLNSLHVQFQRYLGLTASLALVASIHGQSISLEQSLSRALAQSPALLSAQAGVEQYQYLSKQNAQLQNPALVFDAENVGGSDDYSGTDSTEYTLTLEQRLELGGKRAVRKELAGIDLKEANLKEQRIRELLISETRRRFLRLVMAQKRETLANHRLEAATHAANAVKTRQEAGAANALDSHRMDISVSLAEIEYQKTKQQRIQARRSLSALWGAENPDFQFAEAELTVPEMIPNRDALLSALQGSLSWKLNEIDLDRKQLLVEMQKSLSYPDLTLSAGRRWLRADNAEAWNVGLAIDLPLFDRNQHAVRAASAASRQSNFEIATNRRMLREELSQIYDSLATSWNTTRNLQQSTIPKARQTYQLVTEGFELGRYELLYLLEVQQTLFEIESTQLESLSEFFEATADLYEVLAESTPKSLIY